MTHPINLIPFKRLMEKWGLEQSELVQIIDSNLLRVYFDPYYNPKYASAPLTLSPVPSLDFADYDPEKLFFRRTEIESFETKYRNYLPLTASLYSDNYNSKAKGKKISLTNSEKKLRASTEDKIMCQEIASKVWKDHLLDIAYMKMHPDIKRIVGKRYKKKTVHVWLSEVAPDEVKWKGRRDKNYIKEQLSIRQNLNIEVPKK